MGQRDAGATRSGACSQPELKKYVRVTGIRREKFVEFEFTVNDADLTVELILPFSAFDEFCKYQKAVLLAPEGSVGDELEKLAWRSGQPGLLRRVKNAADEDERSANSNTDR
jgi:phenol/toluene 2-monooxygenase (NADH) P0/A0